MEFFRQRPETFAADWPPRALLLPICKEALFEDLDLWTPAGLLQSDHAFKKQPVVQSKACLAPIFCRRVCGLWFQRMQCTDARKVPLWVGPLKQHDSSCCLCRLSWAQRRLCKCTKLKTTGRSGKQRKSGTKSPRPYDPRQRDMQILQNPRTKGSLGGSKRRFHRLTCSDGSIKPRCSLQGICLLRARRVCRRHSQLSSWELSSFRPSARRDGSAHLSTNIQQHSKDCTSPKPSLKQKNTLEIHMQIGQLEVYHLLQRNHQPPINWNLPRSNPSPTLKLAGELHHKPMRVMGLGQIPAEQGNRHLVFDRHPCRNAQSRQGSWPVSDSGCLFGSALLAHF